MTRTVGMLLIVGGLAACVIGLLVLGAGVAQESVTLAGAALGFGLLVLVLVAPLVGGGVLALRRGQAEQADRSEAERLRRLLDMVKTRGQVTLSDAVIELNSDQSSVQKMVYKLVGMGVFSGYVNWDEGALYSAEAASLRALSECKHCGGRLKLAGKGVIKCPFCGTEYFLA